MPKKTTSKPWIDDWGVWRCPQCGKALNETNTSKSDQIFCTPIPGERSCCNKAYDRKRYLKKRDDNN